MVPGLTEREVHALETIRREWLDGELTLRYPALAQIRPAGRSWRTSARSLLAWVGQHLRPPLPVGGPGLARPPVDAPEPVR